MASLLEEILGEKKDSLPPEPVKPAETGDFWTDMKNHYDYIAAQAEYEGMKAREVQNPHSEDMKIAAFGRRRFFPEIRLQELRKKRAEAINRRESGDYLSANEKERMSKRDGRKFEHDKLYRRWNKEQEAIAKKESEIYDSFGVTPQGVLDENAGKFEFGPGYQWLNDDQTSKLFRQIGDDFKMRYPELKADSDYPKIPYLPDDVTKPIQYMEKEQLQGPWYLDDALKSWKKEEENPGHFGKMLEYLRKGGK